MLRRAAGCPAECLICTKAQLSGVVNGGFLALVCFVLFDNFFYLIYIGSLSTLMST